MRFEQPLDEVVARFPEFRVDPRNRTVPYVSHEEIEAAIALGRRLHARQIRKVAGAALVQPLAAIGRKLGRALARAASRLVREYRRDRIRRITIRELSALESHRLRDIGLERGDIVSVAEALADAKFREAPTVEVSSEPESGIEPFAQLRAA